MLNVKDTDHRGRDVARFILNAMGRLLLPAFSFAMVGLWGCANTNLPPLPVTGWRIENVKAFMVGKYAHCDSVNGRYTSDYTYTDFTLCAVHGMLFAHYRADALTRVEWARESPKMKTLSELGLSSTGKVGDAYEFWSSMNSDVTPAQFDSLKSLVSVLFKKPNVIPRSDGSLFANYNHTKSILYVNGAVNYIDFGHGVFEALWYDAPLPEH